MSRSEAKKIIKRYSDKLRSEGFDFEEIYFFGSHAQNKANKWSDIDVAVISDELKKNKEENYLKLWDLRLDVDTRIESHAFTVSEFKNNLNPMVFEIKKKGEKVG
jgi:predicted nucleotidyltransferase